MGAEGAMSDKRKPPEPDGRNVCARCGQHRSDHLLVNYADGPRVGMAYVLCPLPEFLEPQEAASHERRDEKAWARREP